MKSLHHRAAGIDRLHPRIDVETRAVPEIRREGKRPIQHMCWMGKSPNGRREEAPLVEHDGPIALLPDVHHNSPAHPARQDLGGQSDDFTQPDVTDHRFEFFRIQIPGEPFPRP